MGNYHYRLGEYKITESYTGELRWEAHFGLGELRAGRCYKKGSILFLGPVEIQQNGFLKSEFLDHLKDIPAWQKTTYYCHNPELFHCKTGKKVSSDEMRLWVLDRDMDRKRRGCINEPMDHGNNMGTGGPGGDLAFKLQRFKIVKKRDSQILWETYGGAGRIGIGICNIVEDIIFMGSQQNEEIGLNKQQFISNLCLLAEWNQTRYYCPRLLLHECRAIVKTQENRKRWSARWRSAIEKPKTRNKDKKPAESKSTGEPRPRFLSTGLSPIFDGICRHIGLCKSHFSKKADALCTPGFKKWKTKIVAVSRSMIFPWLSLLVGYLKELYKRLRDGKFKHSSIR